MKKLTNVPTLTIPVLALAVIASLLLIFESDFLWKLQEENLFLNSKIFFNELMVEPGGFLAWTSTWFTQFLYHQWLGVLMLCAWWLLLMWLMQRTFRISRRWMPIAVIPVLFLLVTIVDTGYWVYILKLRGHVFLATIGTTAAVALLWVFRRIVWVTGANGVNRGGATQWQSTLLQCAFVVLTCAVGYPLLGVYGLGTTLLMAVWIWRLEKNRLSALAVSLTGLLSVWLLPLFFYHFVYYQTNIVNIYVAKLPLYFVQEEYTSYYVPYILLLAFFLVMSIIPCSRTSSPTPTLLGGKKALPALLLLLLAAFYTYKNWFKDENFHHELAMQHCIEHLDWEGVLEEAAKQNDEPTRAIVMMRNLALANLGRQGDEMYHYKNGCKKCNAPFDVRAINSVGPLIYYYYGMPNYCYRLCMERGVEFGWRAEQLKYMVRCSIVNGEQQLARKYLALLKQTMYHDAWADEMYQYVEHPENTAKMPGMDFISHMMHFDNKLTADQNLVENFLLKHLAYSNYTDDPVFLEQVLYASMEMKDPSLFMPHLHNYTNRYPDRHWPYHVQEAVYLFGMLQERPDMDKCPVSPAVKDSYRRFDTTAPRYEGLDLDQARDALYPLFGNTYFFDYYLVVFPMQN